MLHQGSCHCGQIAFEVEGDFNEGLDCNCSMCRLTGYMHLIVAAADFRLLSGAAQLQAYTFNTGVAKHLFCEVCGIKSFYVPRSNPDGFSVNLRCLDPGTVEQVTVEEFDGHNWERHGAALAHLSQA